MKEKTNLLDPDGRHGGDIQGIIDSMNYFNDMGYTALWLNPVLENNNDAYSYHGYAITDFTILTRVLVTIHYIKNGKPSPPERH